MSHRDHRHHRMRYFRRWIRHHRKLAVAYTVAVLAVLLAAGSVVYQSQSRQNSYHVTAGNSVDMKDGYRSRVYEGKEYKYNSLITTILYAGIDSEGKMEAMSSYGSAARADSIGLAILDKKHEKMSILALNRDTMTAIHRYTRSGGDMGTYTSHLGYAYSYGDGADISCENLQEAVETLLGGIPVTEYVVTNRSSITEINDLVGGVTVTVPNNDLAVKFPEFQEGKQVHLDASNVESYVRYRDTAEDFSNEGRMERQQSYVTAYIQDFQDLLKKDTEAAWQKSQQMTEHLQTSITRSKYLGLAQLVKQIPFAEADYYQLPGEDRQGDLHDEFHLNEEEMEQMILDLFYEEA